MHCLDGNLKNHIVTSRIEVDLCLQVNYTIILQGT
jgi:hypothetical protein